MEDYIFTSERLGFRFWKQNDLQDLYELCSCKEVMKYFPETRSLQSTRQLLNRLILRRESVGFVFYAVELLDTKQFIGFIGFSKFELELPFTPCIEIGWRLKRKVWNKGLATEGALACFNYGFNTLGFTEIFALTSYLNQPSEKVMIKCGMKKDREFRHPMVNDETGLNPMVLYKIDKTTYETQM